MYTPDDEKPIDQQTTLPVAVPPDATTVPTADAPTLPVAVSPDATTVQDASLADVPTQPPVPLAVAQVPNWPPPPRPRPSQGLSRPTRIILIVLALALITSGLGLLIYSTTSQYDRKLGALDGADATSTARAFLHSQATRNAQATRTAGPLQTADAQIYATSTAEAAPGATASAVDAQGTVTAQAQLAALTQITGKTPTLNDTLSDNSQGNTWDTGYQDNNKTGCNFVNGSYQVQEALPTFLRPCFADATSFQNFAYQVSMTLNASCLGGILFRGDKNANTYYLFTVKDDGTYLFQVYKDGNSNAVTLTSGTNSAILGVGQANTLAVIANKGVIDLFVNQAFLAEVTDTSLSKAGQIGVAVYDTNLPAAATFSNAQVWKI